MPCSTPSTRKGSLLLSHVRATANDINYERFTIILDYRSPICTHVSYSYFSGHYPAILNYLKRSGMPDIIWSDSHNNFNSVILLLACIAFQSSHCQNIKILLRILLLENINPEIPEGLQKFKLNWWKECPRATYHAWENNILSINTYLQG